MIPTRRCFASTAEAGDAHLKGLNEAEMAWMAEQVGFGSYVAHSEGDGNRVSPAADCFFDPLARPSEGQKCVCFEADVVWLPTVESDHMLSKKPVTCLTGELLLSIALAVSEAHGSHLRQTSLTMRWPSHVKGCRPNADPGMIDDVPCLLVE